MGIWKLGGRACECAEFEQAMKHGYPGGSEKPVEENLRAEM